MLFGKIIAGLVGWNLWGLPGLLFGLLVGHWFDRGLRYSFSFGSVENLAAVRAAFFEASFLLLGYLSKADGRISTEEIEQTEDIMRQFGLQAAQRQSAIALFQRGASAAFDLQATLARFVHICQGRQQLQQALLAFLISLALADGHLHPAEQAALEKIAAYLGYNAAAFEQLLRMMRAQSQFHGGGQAVPSHGDQLAAAYTALGIAPDCSKRELKLAWRRLMSEHHPDKLIARGVPEQMVKLATEKSQEIQAAYELLKKEKGVT